MSSAMLPGAGVEATLSLLRPSVTVVSLAALFVLEGVLPMFPGRRDRLRHGLRNVALGVLNAGLVAVPASLAIHWVTAWSAQRGLGLLDRLDLPPRAAWVVAFVVFDAWMYGWHVANHYVPFLVRFHAVHHSDQELDASSALRFHFGEVGLSALARLVVVPALGMTVPQLLAYELVLGPVILLHHSNLRLPAVVDRVLRAITVTPRMHWVHHSREPAELNSNFSSVLSVWDRLFGTFRLRADPSTLELGLPGFADADARSLRRLLARPLRRQPRAAAKVGARR